MADPTSDQTLPVDDSAMNSVNEVSQPAAALNAATTAEEANSATAPAPSVETPTGQETTPADVTMGIEGISDSAAVCSHLSFPVMLSSRLLLDSFHLMCRSSPVVTTRLV